MARKTPILLRPGPVSGRVFALTRYRWIERDGREPILQSQEKYDVTEDFEAVARLLGWSPPSEEARA